MTSLSPDLPDWTRQDSAGTVYLDDGVLGPGGSQQFGLVGVASYIIFALAAALGADINLQLSYDIAPGLPIPLSKQFVTAHGQPGGSLQLTYESPSYGGVVTIVNGSTTDNVSIFVMSSQRVVDTPRILQDIAPGRSFSSGGAGFTGGTPIYLLPVDGYLAGYAANVNAGYTLDTTDAGELDFEYVTSMFTVDQIPIDAPTGPGVTQGQVPLPFCIGQLVFTPVADDPTGVVTVKMYPARSS